MDPNEPSLDLVWDSFTGYQRTAAIKAGIELDVFTHIAAGATTIDALAARCQASPRGLRALLNYLFMEGFLVRQGDRYELSATAATFLNRNTPTYLGSAIQFIGSPRLATMFASLTDAVRRGGTAVDEEGTLSPEDPLWVEFARAMAPLATLVATLLANLLDIEHARATKVLDIAAGHGMFGITLAQRNPKVEVAALDWKNVLAVAQENARLAGVESQYRIIPGNAFEVPFGTGYDLILLPNILHHFDVAMCERLLAKCRAALAPGGRVVIVEFIPDDDRSNPRDAVQFALVMLASTPHGDTYTFAEYQQMLRNAGLPAATLHEMLPAPMRMIVATQS